MWWQQMRGRRPNERISVRCFSTFNVLGLFGTYYRLTACLPQRCPQPTRNNTPKPVNLLSHVISICPSVWLSFSHSICQSVYLPTIPSANLPACLSILLSIYFYLSIDLPIYLPSASHSGAFKSPRHLHRMGHQPESSKTRSERVGFSSWKRHQTRRGPYTEVLPWRLTGLDFRNLKTHKNCFRWVR